MPRLTATSRVASDHLRGEIIGQCAISAGPAAQFRRLHVQGDLDLSGITLNRSLSFIECYFEGKILAEGAKMPSLQLVDCDLESLIANNAILDGDLRLEGTSLSATLDLRTASIRGNFSIGNSKLKGFAPVEFDATGLSVGGCLLLTPNVIVTGRIILRHVHVKGRIEANELQIDRSYHPALIAESAVIDGDFDLSGITCCGLLNLAGAHVGGALLLSAARLRNPCPPDSPLSDTDPCTFYGDQIEIEGDCFLNRGFMSSGEVRLLGARIGGDLTCSGSRVEAYSIGGDSLCLTNSRIEKNFFFDGDAESIGRLNCLGMTVGGVCYFENATFTTWSSRPVLCLEQATITGTLRLAACDGRGVFDISRAHLSVLQAGEFSQNSSIELDLRHTHCTILKDGPDFWNALDSYDIRGFRYEAFFGSKDWRLSDCLGWLEGSHGRDQFSPQPYEAFASVQKMLGFSDDAKDILIAMERRRPETWHPPTTARYLARYVLQLWWHFLHDVISRFGYRPVRAFVGILIFLGIGGYLIDMAHQEAAFAAVRPKMFLGTKAEVGGTQPEELPTSYPVLVPLAYSADVLLPFVDFHQEEFWIPNHSTSAGRWIQAYLWFQQLIGWLLSYFAVAAVAGLVKRE